LYKNTSQKRFLNFDANLQRSHKTKYTVINVGLFFFFYQKLCKINDADDDRQKEVLMVGYNRASHGNREGRLNR